MKSSKEIIKQFKRHQQLSKRGLAKQHRRAKENFQFWAGDSMAYKTGITERNKGMVVFNRIKPFVDSVSGFMLQNRRKAQYEAVIDNDEEQKARTEFMNHASDYLRENANADNRESSQDMHMLICGYGATDSAITYNEYESTKEPYGEYIKENIDPLAVWWDPEATDQNLLSSRWVFRERRFYVEEAEKLFGVDKEDLQEVTGTNLSDFKYDPAIGNLVAYDYDRNDKDIITVTYYQWFDIEKYYRVENPLTELFEINPAFAQAMLIDMQRIMQENTDDKNDLVTDLFKFNPEDEVLIMTPRIKAEIVLLAESVGLELDVMEGTKRVFYTALLSGDKILSKFLSLDQQGFTIKFKTGYYDGINRFWFAMVDALRVPALYSNKIFTEMLYIIASNSKGGVMYETSAVDDPRAFEKSYMITGAAVEVNDGAISGNKIAPKQTVVSMAGYGDMLPATNQALQDVTGIDKAFLGSSENRLEAASLQRQRVKQVTSTLATYFDAVTVYAKEDARGMISFIRALAKESSGRIFLVKDDEGKAMLQRLFEDQLADEYQVSIQEAPDDATQKEETAQTLIQLVSASALTDPSITNKAAPLIIKQLDTLSAQEKAEWISIFTPKEPSPEEIQAQQRAQQIKEAAAEAEINNTNADTQSKQASADKSRADSVKSMQEAEQTNLENDAIATGVINDVSLVI